jgi:hypothetical protein
MPDNGSASEPGAPQTAAHAKSPAPIPLAGLRRLILGRTSAREMRASGFAAPVLWLPDARALHHVCEAAGGLRARTDGARNSKGKRGLHSGSRRRPRTPNRPHPYPSDASGD